MWALYIVTFLAFWVLRNMADDLGPAPAFQYAIAWDRFIFGEVPSVALQARWYDGTLGGLEWLAIGVYYSYFLIPLLALVGIWRFLPARFPRYVVASATTFMVAAAVHFLVPTAPPWLASHEGHLPPVTQLIYRALSLTFPSVIPYGSDMIAGNYVAAMPSVHMSVTWLLVLALAPVHRALACMTVGYAALMAFAIVYSGDHYTVDALGGIAVASLAWYVAGQLSFTQIDQQAGSPGATVRRAA